jgi:hypothetical protein
MAAFEAHHVVMLHRATDRDRRRSHLLGRCDVPEAAEGSLHLGNEPGELLSRMTLMRLATRLQPLRTKTQDVDLTDATFAAASAAANQS